MWPKVYGRFGEGETSEIRGARSSRCRYRAARALELPDSSREVLMKNHRNTDVWLERACHLMAVGLSVTAAFLLRFDFSIPAGVGSDSEERPTDCDSGETADLRLGWILPRLAAIREHSRPVSRLPRQRRRLRAICRRLDVLDRADNAAVGFAHRHVLMFC